MIHMVYYYDCRVFVHEPVMTETWVKKLKRLGFKFVEDQLKEKHGGLMIMMVDGYDQTDAERAAAEATYDMVLNNLATAGTQIELEDDDEYFTKMPNIGQDVRKLVGPCGKECEFIMNVTRRGSRRAKGPRRKIRRERRRRMVPRGRRVVPRRRVVPPPRRVPVLPPTRRRRVPPARRRRRRRRRRPWKSWRRTVRRNLGRRWRFWEPFFLSMGGVYVEPPYWYDYPLWFRNRFPWWRYPYYYYYPFDPVRYTIFNTIVPPMPPRRPPRGWRRWLM